MKASRARVAVIVAAVVTAVMAAAAPAFAGPADVATALRDPETLPRRTHVARTGAFGLTADTTVPDRGGRDGVWFDDVPVVDVEGTRVRIVVDEDDARMMMWVDESDLAWAIATETRVAGKGDVGTWLLPGARVSATGSGARRKITARFASGEDVDLRGVVAARALVRVFAATDETRPAHTTHAPSIRTAPGGPALPGFAHGLPVRVLAPGPGDWRLVEHHGRWLRVRGWARERDLGLPLHTHGTGTGGGYGMTHTDRVVVGAGTCLYASRGGPVTGVQLAASTRYTTGHDGAWWSLYVGNAWGLFTVHARALRVERDGTPVFAPCP